MNGTMAETKALAPLPIIEPKVPLPLLEAHAELAAACDDWHDAKGIQYPSPGYPPRPALRKDTSTEFVCYVAQQPHVAIDEIRGDVMGILWIGLVLGAFVGVCLWNWALPYLMRGRTITLAVSERLATRRTPT